MVKLHNLSGKENTVIIKSEPNYPRRASLRAWIFQIFTHSTLCCSLPIYVFMTSKARYSKEQEARQTWNLNATLWNTECSGQPQNQASSHHSHFLLIAKVRSRFCSQAQKSACLFFLLPIKPWAVHTGTSVLCYLLILCQHYKPLRQMAV